MNEKLMNQMLLINEIMRLALLVNNMSEHTIFIDYSGHINALDCRVFINGWREHIDSTTNFHVSFNLSDGGCYMLNTIIEYLNELYMNIDITELVKKGDECFV